MDGLNDYVAFGTPLEPLDDDEAPKKKPIRVEDQIVTDENGRRRFHGAFTGGFSAGYYNTVGTKEGWAPKSFVSSRSSKVQNFGQSLLDIMDDEDKGAHGISHQSVRVKSDYGSENQNDRKRPANFKVQGPIPGEPALASLIVSSKETVGVTLLRKMGWKMGQGIGPRMSYKEKIRKTNRQRLRHGKQPLPEDETNAEEITSKSHSFAPDDIDCLPYTPKDNHHGLGYKGLDDALLSTHINLFEPTSTSAVLKNKSKLKITGQAFGVGAFEDDDEDIYFKEDFSRYDFTLDGSSSDKNNKKPAKLAICQAIDTIVGFIVASRKQIQLKIFPAPPLPRTFRPVHNCKEETKNVPAKEHDRHSLNAVERSHMIGEATGKESVFDLISPRDRSRIPSLNARFQSTSGSETKDEEDEQTQSKQTKIDKMIDSISTQGKVMKSDFKPFKLNEAKQKRYDKFVTLLGSGSKDEIRNIQPSSMTEWEKEREIDEFYQSANLYRPLMGIMASRFITAKHNDEETKVDVSIDKLDDRTDDMKAAEMKMFGQMTRKKFEWHPDRIVCKRFNVPNPYPGCEIVGIPKVHKQRTTLLNFMRTTDHEVVSNTDKNSTVSHKETGQDVEPDDSDVRIEDIQHNDPSISNTIDPSSENEKNEEKRPSIDIFKAIFASDESNSEKSEDSDSDEDAQEASTSALNKKQSEDATKTAKAKHGSGVFANINFDELNSPKGCFPKRPESPSKSPEAQEAVKDSPDMSSPMDSSQSFLYGPKLPPTTGQVVGSIKKKKHKEKKLKKKKSKHKLKKEHKKKSKHKKKHRSSSSSESNFEDDSDAQMSNRDIANRLKRIGGTLKQYM